MYAVLFFFSMWYIFRVAVIIAKNESPTKQEWALYLIASSCLILTDYPGIAVFFVGSILIIFKFSQLKNSNFIFLALSPVAILLIYSIHVTHALSSILSWPTNSGPNILISKFSIFELAKWGYNAFRPVFDLFSPAQKNMLLALVFPGFFALALSLALFYTLSKVRRNYQGILVVFMAIFAFYWVISIPSGHSITRAFLPSLFLMPAFLLLASSWLPHPLAKVNKVLFALAIITNIPHASNPTFRLYNIIPYKAIASDSILIAKKENLNNIFLSGNSLNNLSIKRYIENSNNLQLDISMIPPNFKSDLLNKGDFLFISHMGENNRFLDYKTFINDYGKKVLNIKNYVLLDNLPYNKLWKRQIKEIGFQEYAVSIYVVRGKID